MQSTSPELTAEEIEQFHIEAKKRFSEIEREERRQALRTGIGEDPSGGSLIHALPPDSE